MAEWCTIEHSLDTSSGGGAWVAAMRAPLPGTNHVVIAEVQEGLDAREWRPVGGRTYSERIRGPVLLVELARFGAATSEGFDWALLRRLFSGRVVDDSGAIIDSRPWSVTSANPRHKVDRENWQAIVAGGAPRWLGKGYGMVTAKTHRVCAFGARIQLPANSTLAAIDDQMRRLEVLVVEI